MLSKLILLLTLFQLSPRPYHGPAFYPHPPDPEHLQAVPMNISFSVQKKSWFIKWTEEASGKVRVEQKRPKDGWYICGYQYLDANGKLISPIQIDPTWRNPTVLLIALLDDAGLEITHAEIQVDSKKLLNGEAITEKVVFK
jgi:hypothetical protein